MVKKVLELPYDVVEGARMRLIEAAKSGVPLALSLSGGKDSIVLADLVLTLIREGKIKPDGLVVLFVDEEAIFPSVERIVRDWRRKFMLEGVTFHWFCLEFKHFNCFNRLVNDESFICWDRRVKDRWCRPMPSFAVNSHPLLRVGKDSYQSFLPRLYRDHILVTGVRTAESIQRLNVFDSKRSFRKGLFYPLFDWRDTDVWRYIRDRGLDFPETYLHMYQTGTGRRGMRISQFFSIDTARSLVRLDEFEPDLMDRVVRREPNAYLASLYWETEMFRTSGGSGEVKHEGTIEELRARVLSEMRKPENRGTKEATNARTLMLKFGYALTARDYRTLLEMLVGKDPKTRIYRALNSSIAKREADRARIQDEER